MAWYQTNIGSGGDRKNGAAFGSASKTSGGAYTGVALAHTSIPESLINNSVLTVPAGEYAIDCYLAYSTGNNYSLGQLFINGSQYGETFSGGVSGNFIVTTFVITLQTSGTIEMRYTKTGSGTGSVSSAVCIY